MEQTKTLWLLDVRSGTWGQLIPIYAVDEDEAWVEAHLWASKNETSLPESAILTHFPNGFMTYRKTLPGTEEKGKQE